MNDHEKVEALKELISDCVFELSLPVFLVGRHSKIESTLKEAKKQLSEAQEKELIKWTNKREVN